MSWRWSRLSILVSLGLLYGSPLSAGDKGLWLSVTTLPLQLLEAVPGGTPPEHAILLPHRGGLSLGLARTQRTEPTTGAGVLTGVQATASERGGRIGWVASWGSLDEAGPAPSTPRGPPA